MYGDFLWSTIGKGFVPNDGFLSNAVVPPGFGSLEQTLEGEDDDDGEDGGSGSGKGQGQGEGEGGDASQAGETRGEGDAAASTSGGGAQQHEEQAEAGATPDNWESVASSLAATSLSAPAAAAPAVDGGTSTSGAGGGVAGSFGEDMDELLEMVFMQALHKSVKDAGAACERECMTCVIILLADRAATGGCHLLD